MKILFIGVFADQKQIDKLNSLSQPHAMLSVAAIKHTRLIGDGFEKIIGKNCSKLFLVPIGIYPQCRLIWFWNKKNNTENYIPFINILIIKQISIAFYLFFYILWWYLKQPFKEKKYIVFSSLYLPFLISVSPWKFVKNFKIISFVPDMPEYEFSYSKTKFSIKSILVPLYIGLSKRFVSITDYFIFITNYMVDFYPNKPYSIIEGFTESIIDGEVNVINQDKKAIMYAGSLFEKFGIRILINAFLNIDGDYELWLFGNGDMDEEIKMFAATDLRIKYFGNKSNIEILAYEKRAKLLVNPRPSNYEFTKFSFPSKLMEYMISGTPVLTTKLPGIPVDYYDKMYFIESETVEGVTESLLNCLSKSQEELNLFARKTLLYVLNEKNNVVQIDKLLKSINNSL